MDITSSVCVIQPLLPHGTCLLILPSFLIGPLQGKLQYSRQCDILGISPPPFWRYSLYYPTVRVCSFSHHFSLVLCRASFNIQDRVIYYGYHLLCFSDTAFITLQHVSLDSAIISHWSSAGQASIFKTV